MNSSDLKINKFTKNDVSMIRHDIESFCKHLEETYGLKTVKFHQTYSNNEDKISITLGTTDSNGMLNVPIEYIREARFLLRDKIGHIPGSPFGHDVDVENIGRCTLVNFRPNAKRMKLVVETMNKAMLYNVDPSIITTVY